MTVYLISYIILGAVIVGLLVWIIYSKKPLGVTNGAGELAKQHKKKVAEVAKEHNKDALRLANEVIKKAEENAIKATSGDLSLTDIFNSKRG